MKHTLTPLPPTKKYDHPQYTMMITDDNRTEDF